jgi:F0F1-type ATP synthase epsilon subunit
MAGIALEVVTPKGMALRETGLEAVVVRRREPGRALGSELVVLPRHAPLLVATCAHDVRFRSGEHVRYLRVGAGVAEVLDDTVTLLVSSAGDMESRPGG